MSAKYDYGYGGGTGAGGKKSGDGFSWALIVFFFAIQAWPVALILLFMKLSDSGGRKQRQQQFPPLNTSVPRQASSGAAGRGAAGQTAQSAASAKARAAAQRVTKTPEMKSSTALWMKLAGAALAVFGLMALGDPVSALFWSDGWMRLWLWDFLQAAALVVGGAGLFINGLRMDRQAKRFQKYLAVIGTFEAMSLQEIARKLGYGQKRVEKDLDRMIDKGFFGKDAYLNLELGYFFRSVQADADLSKQARTAGAEPPKEAEEGYSGILRNIRRANDRIADPALSAKIDRLEAIAARIFRAVEEDPKKAGRIDTFLNYYLPTTQKLLDSYAEFEEAGVEGENLRQAKERIEATMDSIVKGFEHQLDELYRADAMDVDSDIRVMETMLGRDTASVEQDFGLGREKKGRAASGGAPKDVDLGGAAAQRQEE